MFHIGVLKKNIRTSELILSERRSSCSGGLFNRLIDSSVSKVREAKLKQMMMIVLSRKHSPVLCCFFRMDYRRTGGAYQFVSYPLSRPRQAIIPSYTSPSRPVPFPPCVPCWWWGLCSTFGGTFLAFTLSVVACSIAFKPRGHIQASPARYDSPLGSAKLD